MVIFRYNYIKQLKRMIFVAYVKFPCFTCFCIQWLFEQELLYKIEYQELTILSASLVRLLYVWLLVIYFIALGKYLIDKLFLLSGQPRWVKRMEFFQQIKTIPWVLSSSHSRTASVARPACISAIVECLWITEKHIRLISISKYHQNTMVLAAWPSYTDKWRH